jgi:hypothetical protein
MPVRLRRSVGANAQMKSLAAASTGYIKDRDTTVRYEVHRMREPGQQGVTRPALVEEFYGLDRARLAALAYALDGATVTGDRFTGRVSIVQVLNRGNVCCRTMPIDELDERVAFRLLNEVALPKADDLAFTVEQLQADIDGLRP